MLLILLYFYIMYALLVIHYQFSFHLLIYKRRKSASNNQITQIVFYKRDQIEKIQSYRKGFDNF